MKMVMSKAEIEAYLQNETTTNSCDKAGKPETVGKQPSKKQ